mmetsp:Transcript_15680/g.23030  ORF Transcript_15680/g.23030 Transcript_15680/m.23030 type:complete len:469 (-) Transcript_15680:324-1730(-)|eukprot:CAMPEP_0113933540 /NCGR_PEP_ID=MMETSP1339-20121228/586_1 /TAXON_ID=94617 /ORGANISM="Fibrocapsa japonica" /LENGTH=468 /DNA_ID=CAMNT_0000934837 /DNA_START=78 /DNA_END=1484 /DNA_ORIENTATION=+ /assembly_acc=CAM_ASM_000762
MDGIIGYGQKRAFPLSESLESKRLKMGLKEGVTSMTAMPLGMVGSDLSGGSSLLGTMGSTMGSTMGLGSTLGSTTATGTGLTAGTMVLPQGMMLVPAGMMMQSTSATPKFDPTTGLPTSKSASLTGLTMPSMGVGAMGTLGVGSGMAGMGATGMAGMGATGLAGYSGTGMAGMSATGMGGMGGMTAGMGGLGAPAGPGRGMMGAGLLAPPVGPGGMGGGPGPMMGPGGPGMAPFGAGGLQVPVRPGAKVCSFFEKTGNCKFGPTCKLNHPIPASIGAYPQPVLIGKKPVSVFAKRPGQPECTFFMKTGNCKFGPTCKFDHPGPASSSGGGMKAILATDPVTGTSFFTDDLESYKISKQFPQRPDAEPCSFFIKTGRCKFGETCRFDHPAPGRGDEAKKGDPKAVNGGVCIPCPAEDYPSRPGQPACRFYMKTGKCSYGASCRWDHPERDSGSDKATEEEKDTAKTEES